MDAIHQFLNREKRSFALTEKKKNSILNFLSNKNRLETNVSENTARLYISRKLIDNCCLDTQNVVTFVRPNIPFTVKIDNEFKIIKEFINQFIENFDDYNIRLSNIVLLQKKLSDIEKLLRKNPKLEYQRRLAILIDEVLSYNPAEDINLVQAKLIQDCVVYFCDNIYSIDRSKYVELMKALKRAKLDILPTSPKVLESAEKIINEQTKI